MMMHEQKRAKNTVALRGMQTAGIHRYIINLYMAQWQ
jgi:hypothetical protein